MATAIIMPKMGMGMTEGTVIEWLKNKGDKVKKGESVVVISSDKIEKDLEAPDDGVLIDIEAEADAVIPVGEAVGYVGAAGEAVAGKPERTAESGRNGAENNQPPSEKAENTRSIAAAKTIGMSGRVKIRISPAARKLAKGSAIDLNYVTGSGPQGRITKADVLKAIAARDEELKAPLKSQPVIKAADTNMTPASDSDREGIKKKTVSGMRKVIAERMYASLQSTAQLTIQMTADVTDLLAFQKQARDIGPIDDEVRLTITDFIAKATALALLKHKPLNSTYSEQTITTFDAVHLGIAVALEEGLVVPVIRHAENDSLSAISKKISALSRKARDRKLEMNEMKGSTFSITSLGTYGVEFFTPILNPPEVGILGVGMVSERPVFVGDEIKRRSLLPLSLTFDHRAVDGAPAAAFLSEVKANLESPFKLVL